MEDRIEKILGHRLNLQRKKEYFVKLKNYSYQSSVWLTGKDIKQTENGRQKLKEYKSNESLQRTTQPFYDPAYDIPDKIIKFEDGKFLTKWSHLSYEDLTLETYLDKSFLVTHRTRSTTNLPTVSNPNFKFPRIPLVKRYSIFEKHLRFQELDQLNYFILKLNSSNIPSISDEFTDGTKLSTASLVHLLHNQYNDAGPFLFLFDNDNNLRNWYDYYQSSKTMFSLQYDGSERNRSIIRELDFYKSEDTLKFHLLFIKRKTLEEDIQYFSNIHFRITFFITSQTKINGHINLTLGKKFLINLTTPTFTLSTIQAIYDNFLTEDVKDSVIFSIQAQNALKEFSNICPPEAITDSKPKINYYVIECPLTNFQKMICNKLIYETYKDDILEGYFLRLYNELYYTLQHPFMIPSVEHDFGNEGLVGPSYKMRIIEHILNDSLDEQSRVLILTTIPFIYNLLKDFLQTSRQYKPITRVCLYSKTLKIEEKQIDYVIIYDGGYQIWNEIIENSLNNLYKVYILENRNCIESMFFDTNNNDQKIQKICRIIAMTSLQHTNERIPIESLIDEEVLHNLYYDEQHYSQFYEKELDISDFWDKLINSPKDKIKTILNDIEINPKEIKSKNFQWEPREKNQLIRGFCSLGWNKWEGIQQFMGLFIKENFLIRLCSTLLQKGYVKNETPISIYIGYLLRNNKSVDTFTLNTFGMPNIEPKKLFKPITLLYFLNIIVESEEYLHLQNLRYIMNSDTNMPNWWKTRHDKYLLKCIYQFGYNNFHLFGLLKDESNNEITNYLKLNIDILKIRSKCLLKYIQCYLLNDISKKNNICKCVFQNWDLNEQSKGIKYIMRYGINENNDDNKSINELSKIQNKDENEIRDFMSFIKERSHYPNDEGIPLITCIRIRQRIEAMKQLRVILRKVSVSTFLTNAPEWKKLPTKEFNSAYEYNFLSELLKYGFGKAKDILVLPKFFKVLNQKLMFFLSYDYNVMKRINVLYNYISQFTANYINQQTNLIESKIHLQKNNLMNNVNVFKLLKFPLQLSATATLHNLGTIVTNRDGFHSERYIYPAGYMASKISAALDNPDEKVRWFTEIIDNGGDAPVFKIWIEGKEEEAFEGNTPTSPFAKAFRSPNSVRKVASISGPDAFSLTNPIVIYLLQLSPQAKDLKRYVFHDLDNNPNVIMFLDSLLDNEVEVEEEV